MAVLAEKTGYEADMIELDMELESELGIDSIKRVEILSEVQDRLGVEAKNVDALSRTRTVGEVIAAMKMEELDALINAEMQQPNEQSPVDRSGGRLQMAIDESTMLCKHLWLPPLSAKERAASATRLTTRPARPAPDARQWPSAHRDQHPRKLGMPKSPSSDFELAKMR